MKNLELFWTGECKDGKAQGYGIAIVTANVDGKRKKVFRYEGKIVDGKFEGEALIRFPDIYPDVVVISTMKDSKEQKAYLRLGDDYIERRYDANGKTIGEKKITDQAIRDKLKKWYKHYVLREHLPGCEAEEHILFAKKYFAKRGLYPIAYKKLLRCYDKHHSYPTANKPFITQNDILFESVRDGLIDGVRSALKHGAKIEHRDKKGRTALILAAGENNKEIVELLLDAGAKIDAQDNKGLTALMNAAYFGHLDTLETLLKRGANVNVNS
jgi:hypothetical protein